MMGQKILCNNVLKLTANRNKCVKSISYDGIIIAFCTAVVYVSERYFHLFILLLNVETNLPNRKPPTREITHIHCVSIEIIV